MSDPPKSKLRWLVPAFLIALILTGVAVFLFGDQLFGTDVVTDAFSDWVKSFGSWGGLGIIALMIIHSFVPFPAEIVAFVAGELLGFYWGVLYVWIGAMLGAVAAFAIARYLGRSFVTSFLRSSDRDKLARWSSNESSMALLTARFIPVIAFNLINYAAGLTHVRWWTFLWTTGIGILPLTVLFVYLGVKMRGGSWTDYGLLAVFAVVIWLAVQFVQRILADRRKPGQPAGSPSEND